MIRGPDRANQAGKIQGVREEVASTVIGAERSQARIGARRPRMCEMLREGEGADMHHPQMGRQRRPLGELGARPVTQIFQGLPRMTAPPKEQTHCPPAMRTTSQPFHEWRARDRSAKTDPRSDVREIGFRPGERVLHISAALTKAEKRETSIGVGMKPLMDNGCVLFQSAEAEGWNHFGCDAQFARDGQHARAIRSGMAMLTVKGAGHHSEQDLFWRQTTPPACRQEKLRIGRSAHEMFMEQRGCEFDSLLPGNFRDAGDRQGRPRPGRGLSQQASLVIRRIHARFFRPMKKPASSPTATAAMPVHKAALRAASARTGLSKTFVEV